MRRSSCAVRCEPDSHFDRCLLLSMSPALLCPMYSQSLYRSITSQTSMEFLVLHLIHKSCKREAGKTEIRGHGRRGKSQGRRSVIRSSKSTRGAVSVCHRAGTMPSSETGDEKSTSSHQEREIVLPTNHDIRHIGDTVKILEISTSHL